MNPPKKEGSEEKEMEHLFEVIVGGVTFWVLAKTIYGAIGKLVRQGKIGDDVMPEDVSYEDHGPKAN